MGGLPNHHGALVEGSREPIENEVKKVVDSR